MCLALCNGQDLPGMSSQMIALHFLLFSTGVADQHPPRIRALQCFQRRNPLGCPAFDTQCHADCAEAGTWISTKALFLRQTPDKPGTERQWPELCSTL